MRDLLFCLFIGIIVVLPSYGAVKITLPGGSDDGLNYLRDEIRNLENELDSKTKKLNKCAAKNKNFQIAGITTVGLTVAGVATNISLYSKMKEQKNLAENMVNKIRSTDTQAKIFANDVEKWYNNLDYEKFYRELDSSLTDAEKQRLAELDNDDYEDATESDIVLFEKTMRAMRNSQK